MGVISDGDIIKIVGHFTGLQHLIVDKCGIFRGEHHEGEWAAFGKQCAIAGVLRARAREKKVKEWLQNIRKRATQGVDNSRPESSSHRARHRQRGRRGIANATISLREPTTEVTASNSSELQTDISIDMLQRYAKVEKIRIVPSSVGLRSICINSTPLSSPAVLEFVTAEFERGWGEGLIQLTGIRTRLCQSRMNGVYMVRYAAPGSEELYVDSEERLDGLVSIQDGDDDIFKAVSGGDAGQ
jgi:hypothetical protein